MTDDMYQILYCSRNSFQGTAVDMADEVRTILASSRANNAKAGVTGALLFNTVFFAQALEGPFSEVQRTFERIQLDPRHSDLMVLQSGYIKARDFGEWSMAFAGAPSEASHPLIAATLNSASSNPSEAGKQLSSLLRDLVLQQEEWALPVRRSSATHASS